MNPNNENIKIDDEKHEEVSENAGVEDLKVIYFL